MIMKEYKESIHIYIYIYNKFIELLDYLHN